MAGQIRISPDSMRERAGEYSAEADKLNDIIARMDTLLTVLQDEWEGASSEAYAAKFAELRPGFQAAEELIRDIAESLTKTANVLEETDANIGSAFIS